MKQTTAFCILLSWLLAGVRLYAQTPAAWNDFLFRAGLDTSFVSVIDSNEISKRAYELAYGFNRQNITAPVSENMDSGKVNAAVLRVLENRTDWQKELRAIEPVFGPYQNMRKTLDSINVLKNDSSGVILVAMRQLLNQYRILNRLPDALIVTVNIPSSKLQVFNAQGEILLQCPVIVGKPDSPTPIFRAYLTRIITYPYWNVPRTIATKEFLPKIKRNPENYLNAMKMQVLNASGQVIEPDRVDWKNITAKNFPYRLRQSTGCDNALGLIKFDLDSPYDVYLHDTNHRELFEKDYRFLSHGCIRVSQPVNLANLLMGRMYLPEDFTQAKDIGLPSHSESFPHKVPLVITYLTVEVMENGALVYYDDIYHKLKTTR